MGALASDEVGEKLPKQKRIWRRCAAKSYRPRGSNEDGVCVMDIVGSNREQDTQLGI